MASRRAIDLKWMDRALELAERGRYTVSPNPMVGAVVVADGRVAGEGLHRRAGGPHAEAVALARAGPRARGADLYVTLEPCAHFGKTPPCADAIRDAGVARVVYALRDPNPLVAGKGISKLRRAGVEVLRADRERAARAARQNERFLTRVRRGRPFVLAKWASTLDGRIASAGGESRWITGEPARRRALLLREEHDAVLVGAGTVIADDPLLTRRLGRNRATPHWRVVLDGRLRIPERARLLEKAEGVIVATTRHSSRRKAERLASRGVEVWRLPESAPGRIRPAALLARLAELGVTGVMVEGGAETLWELFRARTVDRVCVFLAPRLLAGEGARGAVGGRGFPLASTPRLTDVEVKRVGEDLMVTGRVANRKPRI